MTRPVEAGMRLGRYVLLRPIGAGGMAEVWAARDDSLQRTVAIKMILAEIASRPECASRFLREARVAALLDHPHIVKIYDMGDLGGRPYLVTQYLDRGRLTDRLAEGVPTGVALRWLGALASALDFAHGKGVVHRDVKPANVLFDSLGRPYLADFGLARCLEDPDSLTTTGVVLGTPSFMSPEQAMGQKLGPASDQYSLGIVAYDLLTGILPFENLATPVLLYKIIYEAPALPSTVNKNLGARVDGVFMKALDKDPARRFQSCSAFVVELRAALEAPSSADRVSDADRCTTASLPRGVSPEPGPPPMAPPAGAVPSASSAAARGGGGAAKGWRRLAATVFPYVIAILPLAGVGVVVYRTRPPRASSLPAPLLPTPTALRPPPLPPRSQEPQGSSGGHAASRAEVTFRAPVERPSDVVAAVRGQSLQFVLIPPGTLRMGCTAGDPDCLGREIPVRTVKLTSGFQMAATETTNAQYVECVAAGSCRRRTPRGEKEDPAKGSHPVVLVSWEDAVAFSRWAGGRLPTEAEWEYAARGGKERIRFPSGNSIGHDDANFKGVGGLDQWEGTAPVGSFPPNVFGLYDMAGNVREWCAEPAGPIPPSGGREGGTAGSAAPTARVTRGGSWGSQAKDLRVSSRNGDSGANRFVGFRIVRDVGTRTVLQAREESPSEASPRRAAGPRGATVHWTKIPSGAFRMGCTSGDPNCEPVERPPHWVVISKIFSMAVTETTNAQYRVCVASGFCALPQDRTSYSDPEKSDHPVVSISWEDAVQFCGSVGGRLSTEAEWEWAARGGLPSSLYPKGREISHDDANLDGAAGQDIWMETSPVGMFPPNGYGLFDMAGNAWEFCSDHYDPAFYGRSARIDPKAPDKGRDVVVRGGSWGPLPLSQLRVSQRSAFLRTSRSRYVGFRCVKEFGH